MQSACKFIILVCKAISDLCYYWLFLLIRIGFVSDGESQTRHVDGAIGERILRDIAPPKA